MRFIGRRLVALAAVLLVVTILSYGLISLLPGDPAIVILGPNATPHAVAQLREQLHLNDPFIVRYWHWLGGILHGDFGISYLTKQSVGSTLMNRLPVTLEILLISQIMALAISIPLGIISAFRPNGMIDRTVTGSAFLVLSLPSFIVAVLLVYLFAVNWHIFPATGYTNFRDDPFQNLKSVFLPSVTLAVGSLAVYVRVLRAEMIATLQEDFIMVARAKGLKTSYILLRHALRPSTFTLTTVAGLNIGALIGGAFIVEYIFAIPGIGYYTVTSIYQRDYLAVQGAVVVVAAGFVLVNFLVDMLYPLLDPRTRHARA